MPLEQRTVINIYTVLTDSNMLDIPSEVAHGEECAYFGII